MSNYTDPNRLEGFQEGVQASKRQQRAQALHEYHRNWWVKLFPIWKGVAL